DGCPWHLRGARTGADVARCPRLPSARRNQRHPGTYPRSRDHLDRGFPLIRSMQRKDRTMKVLSLGGRLAVTLCARLLENAGAEVHTRTADKVASPSDVILFSSDCNN